MPNVTVSSDVDSMMQAANAAAIKTVLALNNVQNTALTTWTGAATIATVGTLTAGATGAGFTVALGTSTITGVLPAVNFATGTPTGSKFLRDDQSWQTIPGGGDALTANPLSQFAATTSAQLASVLSDENGSGGGFVRATSPTLTTPTISGALTRPDVEIVAANAIGALAIDVTKSLNTKSIAADSTFTFSATPAAGTSFSLLITETGGVARVVTIPSSFSVDRQTTITTMSLGANAKAWLTWYYDGAAYQLVGDSSPNAGLATGLLKNTTTTGALSIAAAGTDYLAPGTTITLAENTSIALDPAGSADGRYTGITVTGTAGATLAFGDLIYLDPTDSRWELTDANSAAAADGDARGMIGICVLAAAADGSATTILLQGIVRADAAFPALTIGAPVYVSETAGDIVVAQPVTTDAVIRIVGYALTADEIYFAPAGAWITHT